MYENTYVHSKRLCASIIFEFQQWAVISVIASIIPCIQSTKQGIGSSGKDHKVGWIIMDVDVSAREIVAMTSGEYIADHVILETYNICNIVYSRIGGWCGLSAMKTKLRTKQE